MNNMGTKIDWRPIAVTIAISAFIFFMYLVLSTITPAGNIVAKGMNNVCFSDICIGVEVADNPEKLAKGLMFREELPENTGMLFVFENEGIYPFWMKNTYIPLDIIWINDNFRVVHIEHAVPCISETCVSYTPEAVARYVVETNVGFVDENNIAVGDQISIPLAY